MICDVCRSPTPAHRSVHVAGRGDLCFSCFADEMAARMSPDADEVRLTGVVLQDSAGESHTFDVVSRFCATGHLIEAIEVREGEASGYSFAVLGDFEVAPLALFGVLYERMRQGLATKHVRRGSLGWELTEEDRLAGRIEWDDATDGEVPRLVIDGEAFTWDQVGKMLMAYEGFVVEMNVRDGIEVIDDRLLADAKEREGDGTDG